MGLCYWMLLDAIGWYWMELGWVAGQSGYWVFPSAYVWWSTDGWDFHDFSLPLRLDGKGAHLKAITLWSCMAIETNLTEISVDLQYCYCHLLSRFALFLVWRVKMASRRSLGLGGLGWARRTNFHWEKHICNCWLVRTTIHVDWWFRTTGFNHVQPIVWRLP